MVLKVRKNKSPAPPACCPLLECMKLIGGAWTPNIIWHLRAGPRRFSELRKDIPQVSPKVLTTRLRDMEECGILERRVLPTSPPSVEYSLNKLGQRLIPAIDAIAEVGLELTHRNGGKSRTEETEPRPRHLKRRAP